MQQRAFRGLGRDAQEALRARAVYLVIEAGRPQGAAAAAVGVSRQVVNRWLRRYAAEGDAGVVQELIWRRRHKRSGLSAVHLYLKRWEFTPQKPLTRATKRSDAAIAARGRDQAILSPVLCART